MDRSLELTRAPRTVDISLPAGRTLRAELSLDHAGQPEALRLRIGWSGPPWSPERGHAVTLPGYVLPDLVQALSALHRGQEQ